MDAARNLAGAEQARHAGAPGGHKQTGCELRLLAERYAGESRPVAGALDGLVGHLGAAAGASGCDRPKTDRSGSQMSWIMADAEALSELAIVDIAAARIAASNRPMRPVFVGKWWTMNSAKTSSGRVGGGSVPRP